MAEFGTVSTGTAAPRITVVIPAYNAAATLPATLDSVLAQEYTNFEVVVVDDGSSDDTLKVATGYAVRDDRIRLVTKPNGGTASAYNAGVSESRTEWIAMISADDTLEPQHLGEVAAAIEAHPEFSVFHTNGVFVYPDHEYVGYRDPAHQEGHEVTFESLIRRCIYGVGATFSRAAYDQVGGYHQGTYAEDWDFWLRIAAAGGRIWYVPTVSWRLARSGIEKSGNVERLIESNVTVLQRLADSGDFGAETNAVIGEEIARHQTRLDRIRRGLPADEPKVAKPKQAPKKTSFVRRAVRKLRRMMGGTSE